MTLYMIGNAHLDPVWLWRWQDGYQETRATFRSALDRMNETEGYVFTSACAQYYQWIEESDPEMFEEIRARVAQKRWSIVGGMWIQPDMNVPCGESVARHLMLSQRYFHEKFGLTVRTGYNVDTFGHGATLPQLLRGARIENYVWMRPSTAENAAIPEGLMNWIAPDGSAVRAFRIPDGYGSGFDGMKERIEKTFETAGRLNQPMMCFYGVGNHGGGPTVRALGEISDYMRDGDRGGEVTWSSADRYFADTASLGAPDWKGELQHHASGCYSTHWQTKKLNRQAENALLRAEKFIVMAENLTGFRPDRASLLRAWKNVLFNQFHDIMGGCSIREGLEDAVTTFGEALSIAAREENRALSAVAWAINTRKDDPAQTSCKESHWMYWAKKGQGAPLVVFNPHPFESDASIQLLARVTCVRDEAGRAMPIQTVRAARTNGTDTADTLVRLDRLPPLGYRVYRIWTDETARDPARSDLSVSDTVLENSRIRLEFDRLSGGLKSLRLDGREYLAAAASARLFDISDSDTWAHMVFKFDKPAGSFDEAQFSVLESGPVRASLCVTTRFGTSVLKQTWFLEAFADQVSVDCVLVNSEKQRMIKLCLPTVFESGRVWADVAYGCVERVPNGDEEPCQRFAALCGGDGGLAVLSDGKYSYSSEGGELRLTVAHSAIFADHYGQKTRDERCEYMDLGEQKFTIVLCPFAGEPDMAGLSARAEQLLQKPVFIADTWHGGSLGWEKAGLSAEGGVEIGAVKDSEDGRGFVLRVREAAGRSGNARIRFGLAGREFDVALSPWQIKSIYVPRDPDRAVRETDFTELDRS